MPTDRELFGLWYANPLRFLKEKLTDGSAGFIVLGVACTLYERYATAVLLSRGEEMTDGYFKIGQIAPQLAINFGVSNETARAFWKVMRHGMLHVAMPSDAENLPRWGFNASYPTMDLSSDESGEPFLYVQPFNFMDRVLQLWEEHFDVLHSTVNLPWAGIVPVPIHKHDA